MFLAYAAIMFTAVKTRVLFYKNLCSTCDLIIERVYFTIKTPTHQFYTDSIFGKDLLNLLKK